MWFDPYTGVRRSSLPPGAARSRATLLLTLLAQARAAVAHRFDGFVRCYHGDAADQQMPLAAASGRSSATTTGRSVGLGLYDALALLAKSAECVDVDPPA